MNRSAKIVHQPLELMSSSVRNDVMNRPTVGIVHSTAITIAASDAHGEVSALWALLESDSCLATVASTSLICGAHRASSLRI